MIPNGEYVRFHALYDWDGADGTCNSPSGFVTTSKTVAEEWTKRNIGASYRTIEGIMIRSLENLEDAQQNLKRQRALDKLTPEEKGC